MLTFTASGSCRKPPFLQTYHVTQRRNIPCGSGLGSYSVCGTGLSKAHDSQTITQGNMISDKRSFFTPAQCNMKCVAEDNLTQVAFSSVVTDR